MDLLGLLLRCARFRIERRYPFWFDAETIARELEIHIVELTAEVAAAARDSVRGE